jgi:hypothetical protein
MADTIKLAGSEISLSTANTIGRASLVRVYNNTAGAVLITYANTTGTIGTMTMGTNTEKNFTKQPAETLASNAAVLAVAITFSP